MLKKKLNYEEVRKKKNYYQKLVNQIATMRLIIFGVCVLSFILKYYYYPKLWGIIFIITLILFIFLLVIHEYYYRLFDYYEKKTLLIETYLKRENGEWKKFLDKGEDLITEDQFYESDLDIFGDCSLFQYLTVCKTKGGRERLAKRLKNIKYSPNKLKEEQEAVKEVTENIPFVLDFQIALYAYTEKGIYLSKFWKDIDTGITSRNRDFGVATICSSLTIILLILGLLKVLPLTYFEGIFLFNFMISFLYSQIFHREFSLIDKTVNSYSGLYKIANCLKKTDFNSLKLNKIKNTINEGERYFQEIKKMDALNSLKKNFIAMIIANGLGCTNIILLYLFSKFCLNNKEKFYQVLTQIEELEALLSITSLGIVRESKCLPTLEENVKLEFTNLKHPLLLENKCTPNDFKTSSGVEIITGSNMGGKTTFLRTIGINLILMNAGGYVCASTFNSCYFKIFTSMRVSDNIDKGISTFYGELLRIQKMVAYVDEDYMLVLIDEIFKGTNYNDRMYGAREVIKKLKTPKTLAFITTHDFELCDEEKVCNYHVRESYQDDKIIFDYKIRKGKCTTTNAKYLMKKLGIIE